MRLKAIIAAAALAIVALSVSWSSGWQEAAPEPSPSKAGTRTALADLTRVFTEHAAFKQKIELMRLDVEKAEKELKVRQDELAEECRLLEKMSPGSAKRKAQEKYDLDVEQSTNGVKRQKRQFEEQEAEIYVEIYEQVMAVIAAYAEQEHIELVLRFNGSLDPDRRSDLKTAMEHLNRQVLYHNGIDITDEIIRRVNAG